MFGLGMPELIIILVIVILIFGAGRISEIGGAIGKGIKGFKKSVNEPDSIDVTPNQKDKQEKDKDPQKPIEPK
ncbi:MAG: Sec-independent protein translocase protein TatA [Syntrophorhabdus sp. PtaB.Bin184]|jgi:sec-independent protein translocase protein TatA|nr:MAG: Sec-independent protein translocase protein TatA [Syntrophorhabdus sp. PtaB.Bin184]